MKPIIDQLYLFSSEIGLHTNLDNINTSFLKRIYKKCDQLSWNNLLTNKNIQISFRLQTKQLKNSTAAGIYQKTSGKYTLTFMISMLGKFKGIQRANGIFCHNKLECFLNIFVHELTHIVVDVLEPNEPEEHSQLFQDIVREKFQHTHYEHEFDRSHDYLHYEKDELYSGKKITYVPQTGKNRPTEFIGFLTDDIVIIKDINNNKKLKISYTWLKK